MNTLGIIPVRTLLLDHSTELFLKSPVLLMVSAAEINRTGLNPPLTLWAGGWVCIFCAEYQC